MRSTPPGLRQQRLEDDSSRAFRGLVMGVLVGALLWLAVAVIAAALVALLR